MATVPLDGRMTSFNSAPAPLQGDEIFWIVQPGNAQAGVLYKITAAAMAAYFAASAVNNTVEITSGATSGNPYQVPTSGTRFLFNKAIGSASFAVMPLAADMDQKGGVVFKDLKGDADVDPITVTFSGSELCDGLTQVVIASSYGWFTIYPTPGGGSWYMGP